MIRDRYFSAAAGLSLILLMVAAGLFYVEIGSSDKPLILHFDSYRGIDFLGNKTQVLKIILSALILFLINFSLAASLYHRQRFLSYLFVFATLAIAVLILMAIGVIIAANG